MDKLCYLLHVLEIILETYMTCVCWFWVTDISSFCRVSNPPRFILMLSSFHTGFHDARVMTMITPGREADVLIIVEQIKVTPILGDYQALFIFLLLFIGVT